MSKLWLAIVIILLLAVASGGWFVYKTTQTKTPSIFNQPTSTNSQQSVPTPTKSQIPLTNYTDESGFSFQYPSDFQVQPATDLKANEYTKLALSGKGQQFNFSFTDTKFKTIADWLKSDPMAKGATLSGAATLGGLSAEQYAKDNRLYTIAIDQGVLYLIDGPSDSSAESTYTTLTDTFKFAGQETTTSPSNSGAGSDTVYEDEEVIE